MSASLRSATGIAYRGHSCPLCVISRRLVIEPRFGRHFKNVRILVLLRLYPNVFLLRRVVYRDLNYRVVLFEFRPCRFSILRGLVSRFQLAIDRQDEPVDWHCIRSEIFRLLGHWGHLQPCFVAFRFFTHCLFFARSHVCSFQRQTQKFVSVPKDRFVPGLLLAI